MSGDGWDELLRDAQERLREQVSENVNADVGDEMTPEPEQCVMGRWRGTGPLQTKRGVVDVYLIWDRDDRPGFLYQHARLVQEVENENPQIGDRVLVLRGPTETFERDGETRTIYPYVLRRQACDDPLPDRPAIAETAVDEPADADDIPF